MTWFLMIILAIVVVIAQWIVCIINTPEEYRKYTVYYTKLRIACVLIPFAYSYFFIRWFKSLPNK